MSVQSTYGVFALALLALVPVGVAACSDDLLDTATTSDEAALRLCAESTTVEGIDVSHYQAEIDWAQVRASGKAFAFIRAAAGTNTDRTFATNWAEAKRVGVLRGAYQYFYPGRDVAAQAELFLSRLEAAGGMTEGDLPPVLDVETRDGASPAKVQNASREWLATVEERTGVRPIVYTGNNMSSAVGTALANYLLWVPNYQATCPLMPAAWEKWTFWQTSDKGKVPGVKGNCDLDLFNGTMEELMQLTVGGNGALIRDGGVLAVGDGGSEAAGQGPFADLEEGD